MISWLIIAAIWLGCSALALLWVHCATRKPDPEWPEWPEFDVLGEADEAARKAWTTC